MSRAYKMADQEVCLAHQLQTSGSGGGLDQLMRV